MYGFGVSFGFVKLTFDSLNLSRFSFLSELVKAAKEFF
jgi:hypothetical protein